VAPWYFAEIYVANADGRGLRRLTENSVGDRWPTWLPDGRIFFVSNRAGPQDLTNSDASEYYVMNRDGTGVQLSRWNPRYS
jgi:Tol biopolymer transport system component